MKQANTVLDSTSASRKADNIAGGYKTQTVIQLGNLVYIYNVKGISLRALRVYLAALVAVASREAARRATEKSRPAWKNKKAITPRFLFEELAGLTSLTVSNIKKELKNLEKTGLLLFTDSNIQFTKTALPGAIQTIEILAGKRSIKRPIPLPRPVLRYLAKEGREGSIKTTLAYIIRGLSITRKGQIKYKGTTKAAWIAESTGLSLRSVRSARKELIALNFITDDEGSKQWKLNRDGAYFTINLNWKAPQAEAEESAEVQTENPAESQTKTYKQLVTSITCNFAPPTPKNCTHFASPYKDKKTLNRSKNQKTRPAGQDSALRALSGFCGDGSNKSHFKKQSFPEKTYKTKHTKKIRKPILRDIKPDDLKRLSKLKILYTQAIKAKWLEPSEANFQNFVSAAVRATRTEGDSVRIFVSIVKKGLWINITQAQEDRAREIIQKNRNKKLEMGICNNSLLSKLGVFAIHNES